MNNYNQLKEVLNDIFELNKADLDFGIYRIINQKRKQVNEFIEKQLPEDIKKALSETQSSDKTEVENELKTLRKNLDDAGIVAEESPKYKLLKERLQGIENSDVLEQEVFSHLANFFRRYYKDGDFISMRRYKRDVYAIPYEGEEVKLHWANHDQYYIKSSENFKNYSFNTPDGKKITFQLREVSTEQNNNKTQGYAERRFAIYYDLPVEESENELLINFIYEPFSKTTKQESLLNEALEILSDKVPISYSSVFTLSPTEKNGKRTLLEKHLNDYVSKNSFDYFIHKDLGGFLSRELDFYIKNEVLYIDDINIKQSDFFIAQLSKVKAIKVVAEKVIDFLAQIENFQKKLWLKKKFVIRTDYCITLDKILSSYYPEIFKNKEQLEEWKMLFGIEIINEDQLKSEPFLVLDTKFFDESFKDRLLAEFDDLEKEVNGYLINSENFQALNFLEEKFFDQINGIYIDPPYNTNSSEIVYKNSYKHSSWISLLQNRIFQSKKLMQSKGLICMTIDDLELPYLWTLGNELFDLENHLGTAAIRINPGGRKSVRKIAFQHEYAIFYGKSTESSVSFFEKKIEDKTHKYILGDDGVYYEERNLRKEGQDSLAKEGSERFYPIYRNTKTGEISSDKQFDQLILPIDTEGNKRIWRRGKEVIDDMFSKGDIFYKETKFGGQLYFKFKGGTDGEPPRSFWDDKKFSASEHGTQILDNIIGKDLFSFPKSIHAVVDCLRVMSSDRESLFLDYFSGSGTTGHATIKLNREDGGNRKYILVEMGTYFNTVTKPRIQKVIYSDNWKNGKPQDKNGISQIVKYQVLESYEDTLNNLVLNSQLNQAKLDFSNRANEEYMLQYMLEMESREHLFNLDMFRKPFDYQLNVTENNELKPTKVDLVETFNYLIGLYVNKVQRVKDIKVVEGVTRTGVKTLVIWRDIETTTHDDVEKLIRRFYDSQRTKEFDQIFINGDHHLENLRQDGDHFKVKMIEETFFKKMFNETEL